MLITKVFNIPVSAHTSLPFVNVDTEDDTRLFIDSGLIRNADDPISKLACVVGDSFLSEVMDAYQFGGNPQNFYGYMNIVMSQTIPDWVMETVPMGKHVPQKGCSESLHRLMIG